MGAVYPDQNDVTPNFVTPSGVEPYEPKPQTFGQKASDAFLLNNDVVNLHRRMNEQQYPVDPDHNPKDMLAGTHYWDNYSDNFIASRSEPQTRDIMRRIDEEEAAKARSAESGPMGTALDLAAGVLSPTVFLPAGQIVRSARGGYSALKSALSVGVAGGLQTAAQEAVLQGTQETRTLHESLINVGSGTLLAGILGAGGSKLLNRFETAAAARNLDRVRAEIDAHIEGRPVEAGGGVRSELNRYFNDEIGVEELSVPAANLLRVMPEDVKAAGFDVVGRGGKIDRFLTETDILDEETIGALKSGRDAQNQADAGKFNEWLTRNLPTEIAPTSAPSGASSVGAAGTDARQLEMFPAYPGMNTPGRSVSPTRTLLNATSTDTRRIAADLASGPYRFKENVEGVATSQGPPVDIQQRMAIDGTEYEIGQALKGHYSDYFFGEKKRAPVLQSRYQRMTGASDKMSYDEFKAEVGKAWMNNGTHELPQATAAARAIMEKVEEWAKRADVSIEGFKRGEQATGEAYFPHLWNKKLIQGQKPEFINWLTGIYKTDQLTKQGAQERIGAYHGALTSHTDSIEKLTAKIAKLNEDVDVIAARAEETTRINKFANQRATTLREAVTTSARPEDNLLKAQGGAVFETKARTRGNELADRASGKLAAIDDLEQKLAKEIANHDEMRAKIEDELGKWEGTSSTEAKSAMKARAKAEADRIARAAAKSEEPPTKRLTSADDAVDMAVKRIMESDRARNDAELRSRASETTDRIIGSPDGRLPYDEHLGGPQIGKTSAVPNRGALAHRRLDVTNTQAAPWIEQDAEHVLASYMRTVVPDVLLSEKFGDPEMTVAFKQMNESYNHLIDQTKPGKARDALTKEHENSVKVMAAIRDRLRGVYGWSENTSNMAKVAQSVKVLNNISDLGSSAIASLPDFAGPLFRWGIVGAIRDGWAPFFQAISAKGEEGKQFTNQMRAIGIGIDVATNARQHSMDEITGAYKPGSPIERTLQTVNDKFFIANLLAPLTDMQKMIAAHAAVHEVINISRRVSEGKATAREIGNLAEGGIDGHMAGRIWREFNTPGAGEIVGKVYLPNTATWTDRGAADAFNGAIYREVNIAVVSPGQEKPLFLSRPVGSLLGQFKTFTAAANERILVANLQRRDAQSLSGVVAAIGLGMLSYKINALTGGQPTSDKPADWFREGVSRSGMLGWLEEGNAALAKASGGKADLYRLAGSDKPLTRYAGRNTLDMVLGPTVGKARDLLSAPGPLFRGDWSASDTHQIRRLMPFENMFYLRGLFNKVEETTNSHFNIPERRDQTLH